MHRARARVNWLLLWALALLPVAGAARAEGWKPAPQRRSEMVDLANRAGLPKASQSSVDALNRRYGLSLSADQVRIVSFTRDRSFWRFVDGAKSSALGLAVTPHDSGPHPHLLVGDYLYDGIQPGWTNAGVPATFRDGTMMRKDRFGTAHRGTTRLFCIFNAPTASLTAVGLDAEALHNSRRKVGYNCALLATERLAEEGRRASGSPFANLQPSAWPSTAVERVLRAKPDLVLQVLPEPDFDRAMRDATHQIRFWQQQR